MARSVDVANKATPAYGYDMVNGPGAKTATNSSPAMGAVTSGLSTDGNAVAVKPAASLGTGMNADVYTAYSVEAV